MIFRLWWNRLLVRLRRVDPLWQRGTYDPETGWHSSYRLLTGGKSVEVATAYQWIETHRWHDSSPVRVLDTAIDWRMAISKGGASAKWRRALTDQEIREVHDDMHERLQPTEWEGSGWRLDDGIKEDD